MTSVGTVYAQALYSLAKDEDCCKVILDQLTVLQESFAAEPDFLRLLAAPNLSKEERCAIVDSSFRDKVHPYLLNFMKILTEKGYMRHFADCCKAYRHSDCGYRPGTDRGSGKSPHGKTGEGYRQDH